MLQWVNSRRSPTPDLLLTSPVLYHRHRENPICLIPAIWTPPRVDDESRRSCKWSPRHSPATERSGTRDTRMSDHGARGTSCVHASSEAEPCLSTQSPSSGNEKLLTSPTRRIT